MQQSLVVVSWSVWLLSFALPVASQEPPIFDVHLHALPANAQGPPPLPLCAPLAELPHWDPAQPYGAAMAEMFSEAACDSPIVSPTTDQELLERTVATMERRNVYGVLSGSKDRVTTWTERAPGRFTRGLGFRIGLGEPSVEELRRMVESGDVEVLAEVTNQYAGILPEDERMAPYWALAERLDLPVGIHIGPGPPGAKYLGNPAYRAAFHSALTLEPVL